MTFQYQGGNMMRGAAMQNGQQQSFFDQLARGISNFQQGQLMDQKKKQLEAEALEKANDPERLAQEGFMILSQGGEISPQHDAAMKWADAKNRAKVTTDQYGNKIKNDSFFDLIAPQLGGVPKQQGTIPQGSNSIPAGKTEGGFNLGQFTSPEVPQITNKAEEMAYAQKLAVETEQKRDKRKEEQEAKSKAESNAKIEDALNQLYSLNETLMNEGGLRSEQRGIKGNAGATLANAPIIGSIAQGIFDPATQSKRSQYEKIRDSIIPFYIEANNLPATVVDTEEFQQRILSSFGDPSSDYESNEAALKNMAGQFGVKLGKPSKNKPNLSKEQALEILRQRGRVK